jgi:hypothetical protein
MIMLLEWKKNEDFVIVKLSKKEYTFLNNVLDFSWWVEDEDFV